MDTNWTPVLPENGPRYRALADEIGIAIEERRLPAGAKLPPVRDLAWRLQVTPGTVARAYRLAEQRGLLEGQIGRGTFVRETATQDSDSSLRGGCGVPHANDTAINFRMNHAPAVGQDEIITAALKRLIAREGALPFTAYRVYEDLVIERAAHADWLRQGGVPADPSDTVLTGGAQLGILTALASSLGGRDAAALTEPLIHPGLIDCARALGVRLEPVECDEHGLSPDAVEAAIERYRPSAVLLSANLQNPTLTTMPLERREKIAEITQRLRVEIIEDDVYGWLNIQGRPPSFIEIAPANSWLITSFSKCAAAGLRAGCLVTPPGRGARAARMLKGFAHHMPYLSAALATQLIRTGDMERIQSAAAAETRRRTETLRALLGPIVEKAGGDLRTEPDSQFAWLRLPKDWRASTFEITAERRGVHLLAAEIFAVGRAPAPHAARIALGGASSIETVKNGAAILGDLLGRSPAPTSVSA